MDSEPVAFEPVAERDATTVTNEASGPAQSVTNEAIAPADGKPDDGASIATNEASSGDGEVERAGTDSAARELPRVPLVVDVGRSGPSQEDERGARAGGPVACSLRTVTAGACALSIVIAGACAPIAVIAGACASVLGEVGPVGGQSPLLHKTRSGPL